MQDPILICEICTNKIGKIKMDKLDLPLEPDMFGSFEPERGRPVPFDSKLEWLEWWCPYCNHRPILEPNRLLSEDGYIWVKEKVAEVKVEMKVETKVPKKKRGRPRKSS